MSEQLANPEKCRGSNLVQAIQELAASRSFGTLRIGAPSGSLARELTVDYEPCPEIVWITATGPSIPKVTLAMQIDNSLTHTWPMRVVWPAGEVAIYASFSTGRLRFETSDNDSKPRIVSPKYGPWKKIEGNGTVPTDVIEAVRAIVMAIDPGPRECSGTAAWCGKYASKFLGFGTLCALSFGGDSDSCQEAHDGYCDWCDCKGYDCKACD